MIEYRVTLNNKKPEFMANIMAVAAQRGYPRTVSGLNQYFYGLGYKTVYVEPIEVPDED